MDEVFRAMADPGRRRLLDSLNSRNGQNLRELCAELEMARQSVSKHLAVLEAANLVTTVRRGREKLHFLNPVPINAISERWINQYNRGRVAALADLKTALEQRSMSATEFVYTTYIKTTPELLWQALTEPSFTRRYWGVTFESDWQPGSTMSWEQFGVTITDPEQVVIASDPYSRLAYSWHTVTPEFTTAAGIDEQTRVALAAESRSTVTFDIVQLKGMVKLTVTHNGFDAGSTMLAGISDGWPAILAGLKTLLETGESLPEPAVP